MRFTPQEKHVLLPNKFEIGLLLEHSTGYVRRWEKKLLRVTLAYNSTHDSCKAHMLFIEEAMENPVQVNILYNKYDQYFNTSLS